MRARAAGATPTGAPSRATATTSAARTGRSPRTTRSGIAELLAAPEPRGLLQERVAERDVAQAEPAVPEQDRLRRRLAAGPGAGDDLAELGVQGLLGQAARLDVRPQRAERPGAALAPVVDHQLVHDVRDAELDGAHRPVRHHQRAGRDPLGAQERLGPLEARGL